MRSVDIVRLVGGVVGVAAATVALFRAEGQGRLAISVLLVILAGQLALALKNAASRR